VYTTVALVAAAAVIAFVAIEGGFSPKGGSHSGSHGLDLAAFVTASAKQTLSQKTADITVTGTVNVGSTAVDLHGNGQLDFATNTGAINLSASFSGGTLAENEIITTQALYMQVTVDQHSLAQYLGGRHWLEVPAVTGTHPSPQNSLTWNLQLLAQHGARVVPMGTQDIGGLNCSEYSVTPTRQGMLAAAEHEWAEDGLSSSETAAARQILENSPPPAIFVWLDPSHQLTCQVAADVQLSLGSSGSGAPSAEGVQMLLTFSHYGTPVNITPPAQSDTYSLSS
jgi:hypothetical protein